MIKDVEQGVGSKLFENLNYLYFENNNKFKNENFTILERYQPPLEESADVFYVVNYDFNHKFFIRMDSITYNKNPIGDDGDDNNKHTEFINYITFICRKIKIENLLKDE